MIPTSCGGSSRQSHPVRPVSEPPPHHCPFTGEGDVEALVGDGEVGEEADLGGVVPEEPRAQGGGQGGARQPPQGLGEAAVLRHQQVVVGALQVEGVEGELHTCGPDGGVGGKDTDRLLHFSPLIHSSVCCSVLR